MANNDFGRRDIVAGGLSMAAALTFVRSLAASPVFAADDAAPPTANQPQFTAATVIEQARRLSQERFSKPSVELPAPFDKLSYDQYRDIRFKTEHAIWRGQQLDFELQLFPIGWLYEMPVEIFIVDQGTPAKLTASDDLFTFGPLVGGPKEGAPYGFSGFRIHSPINRADYYDEYVVFQGASYFRAVGRGESYGASARGLAINTARAGGEEFPFFRTFWIEKPSNSAAAIIVHALLDSPSTSGAYRFVIQPGEATEMEVEATLFPRTAIQHLGIAPLTSMFLHGPASPSRRPDFRPEVHDSEGLAIWNGRGELLWRPLANPKTLQVSAFMDENPKGFGLWQRGRDFRDFQDLEAHYERRPSIWVEPKGSWGEGFVELIEIPVDDEIHDNIAAYWKPSKGLDAGGPYRFDYRLYWSNDVPVAWAGARVVKTRTGAAKKPQTILFVIDFEGPAVKDVSDLPVATVNASPGTVANIVVQRNPAISGLRVAFEMNPGGSESVEMRLVLKAGEQAVSESWLYRWTKP
jgi:glucans biosynthesis protein